MKWDQERVAESVSEDTGGKPIAAGSVRRDKRRIRWV
jgi:hypothetical protein